MIIQEVLEKVLINQRLVMIGHKSSAYEAAISMLKNKCGALLVCNSNNNRDLVGIITERDITFKVIPKNLNPKATEVLTFSDFATKYILWRAPWSSGHSSRSLLANPHSRRIWAREFCPSQQHQCAGPSFRRGLDGLADRLCRQSGCEQAF